jgi:hypothetical protein
LVTFFKVDRVESPYIRFSLAPVSDETPASHQNASTAFLFGPERHAMLPRRCPKSAASGSTIYIIKLFTLGPVVGRKRTLALPLRPGIEMGHSAQTG